MTIKAIIWDFGGVLLRTMNSEPRTKLASEFGMTRYALEFLVFASPPGLQAQKGKIKPDKLWDVVLAEIGAPPDQKEAVQSRFWGGDALDTELVSFIRSLKSQYKTALLSNAWLDLRQMLSDEWGIADIFDEIIISAEVGLMKPDPGIYQIALAQLDLNPEETVFIDDFSGNVDSARKVGIHAIQFVSPAQTKEELSKLLADNA